MRRSGERRWWSSRGSSRQFEYKVGVRGADEQKIVKIL